MSTWVMLAVIGGLMILMMVVSILPQKKKRKQAQEMMSSIKKGDKIKTIGGFVGTVVAIDDATNTMILNLATEDDQTMLVTIDKNAVYTVINPIVPQTVETTEGEKVTVEQEGVIALDDISDDKRKAEKDKSKAEKKDSKKNASVEDSAEIVVEAEIVEENKF